MKNLPEGKKAPPPGRGRRRAAFPRMPMWQAIGMAQGHLLSENPTQLALGLLRGDDHASRGAFPKTSQERLLLRQGQVGPATTTSASPAKTVRPFASVLAHPEPHGLSGKAQ